MRQTPRLWTTARFQKSILPKWTREQDFQSRFARNTHHSNIFLLDICDAITFLLWPSCHQAVSKLHCFAFCLLNLHSCNLHNCDLHSCSLHYCNLHSCNCSLHNCNLHSCDLHSCNLHNLRHRYWESGGLMFVPRILYSMSYSTYHFTAISGSAHFHISEDLYFVSWFCIQFVIKLITSLPDPDQPIFKLPNKHT